MKGSQRFPLLITATLQFTSRLGMGLLLQFRMRELGAPLFLVSLISSVRGGTSAVMSSVWGSMSDRKKNRKKILIVTSIGAAIFTAFYPFSRSPIGLISIAAAVAVFSSGFNPVAMALSTEYSSRKSSQARELSFLNSSNSLGMLFGRLMVGTLLLFFNVKSSMLFLVTLAWISVIPVFLIKEAARNSEESGKEKKKKALRSIMARNGLWSVYTAAFMRQFGISGTASLVAIYLTEKLGLEKSTVGFVSAINPVIQTPSHIFFGKVAEKIGPKTLAILGVILSAAVAFTLLIGKSLLDVSIAYGLLGLAFGAFINGTALFVSKSTNRWERAQALGILNSSRQIGFMLGPIVAGILASISYDVLFLTMGVVMMLGAILLTLFSRGPDQFIQGDADCERKIRGKSS